MSCGPDPFGSGLGTRNSGLGTHDKAKPFESPVPSPESRHVQITFRRPGPMRKYSTMPTTGSRMMSNAQRIFVPVSALLFNNETRAMTSSTRIRADQSDHMGSSLAGTRDSGLGTRKDVS